MLTSTGPLPVRPQRSPGVNTWETPGGGVDGARRHVASTEPRREHLGDARRETGANYGLLPQRSPGVNTWETGARPEVPVRARVASTEPRREHLGDVLYRKHDLVEAGSPQRSPGVNTWETARWKRSL